jgi:hypothetical protein
MRYQVVGECCVPGLTNGEAILGPISDEYRHILVYDEALKNHRTAFLNANTGEVQNEDPRLKSLLENGIDVFKKGSNHSEPAQELNLEALRMMDVQVTVFELE